MGSFLHLTDAIDSRQTLFETRCLLLTLRIINDLWNDRHERHFFYPIKKLFLKCSPQVSKVSISS